MTRKTRIGPFAGTEQSILGLPNCVSRPKIRFAESETLGMARSIRQHWTRSDAAAITAVAVCVAGYALLAVYFQWGLHTSKVYNHFAYIPIVFAAIRWGRRAVVVAAALGGVNVAVRLVGGLVEPWWNDAVRVLLFVSVAVVTGLLSERLRREHKTARESKDNYRRLLDTSPVGIVVYGAEGVVYSNPRLLEMLDFRAEDAANRSVFEFIDERDRDRVRALLEGRRTGGASALRYECRLRRRDGGEVWVDIASAPIVYREREAVLVSVYNITDLKRAELESQRLRDVAHRQEEQLIHSTRLAELGEMAAAIAHEINQPMTGIRNFAQNAAYMIDNDAGTLDDVRDNLRLISEQVDRAARIIGRMRELSRKSERELEMLDINALLRESLQFLQPQLSLSNVQTAFEPDPAIPRVLADKIRLEQVFLNLLTNARQAMDEVEHRRLTVRTRHESGAERPVCVDVADTGQGFAPADAERLFVPFYTTKKAGHGTGLGLSISINIIKDHHGTIEAHSVPGQGARFTVRLPLTH